MNDEPSHVHWNGCGAKKNHLGSSQSVWKRPQSWRVADSDHQIWGNVELDLFRLDFIFLFTLISISAPTLSTIKFGETLYFFWLQIRFLPPWHGIYISIQLISWHYIIPALSQITVKLCFSSMFFPRRLGGRGANKALGRVLLEQNVNRQTCQREAVNAMFTVENPYSEWA